MRTAPAQLSFSSGEVSPLLAGRSDYQRYRTGVAVCRGFIPLRQGAVTRAPGTFYRGRTLNDERCRFISFEFNADDAVVLELTAGKLRVWRYGALVLSGGVPYELTLPYTSFAAIKRLKWVQSADVVYLVDGVLAPQRLARFALDNWTIAPVAFVNGPFEPRNIDEAQTLTVDGATGSITVTASAAMFVGTHVGALFRLEAVDWASTPAWTGNTAVSIGDLMRYDGAVYRCESVGPTNKTGVNAPVHKSGSRLSEKDGVLWKYMSGEAGVIRITGVTSGTVASADVVQQLPADLVSVATYRWAEGAWSDRLGYPAAIAIHEQRLCLAATPTRPRTIWLSTLGAFEDFEPGTNADSAFAYAISGSKSLNRVLWLISGSRGLYVGALGETHSSRSSNNLEAIGPENAVFGVDTTIGSADIQPVAPDGNPIFIARDAARVFELRYDFGSDRVAPIELSLPAEHLGAAGFAEIDWQSAPIRVGWIRRDSGDMVALIHDPAEEVLGWAPIPTAGGHVEAVAVSRDAAGILDTVLICLRRTVGGETRRYVEEFAPFYGVLTGADDIAEAVHLYSALLFQPGAATDTFAGLDHLEGKSVNVWTNLGEFGPVTVQGGTVTIELPVTRALIGLFDTSHSVVTLDIPVAVRDGDSTGRQKKIISAGVRMHRSGGARFRSIAREFAKPDQISGWSDVTSSGVPADLVAGATGVVEVRAPGGYAKEIAFEFRPIGGAPLTVLGVIPIVEANG